ncbi:hypothetical protein ACQEVS_32995 [Streptomyces sp. CA-181903]|uniref:hypothetical protein n=1 Tax=Streptomyces sp. CA-181903 TaxID=3240055 RepID=UPI003D9466ED
MRTLARTDAATVPLLFSGGNAGQFDALPWAGLLDEEDLTGFLGDLADAAGSVDEPGVDGAEVLRRVRDACRTWWLIGVAQHGHNTAPGPVERLFRELQVVHPLADGQFAEQRHLLDVDVLAVPEYGPESAVPVVAGPGTPRNCSACGGSGGTTETAIEGGQQISVWRRCSVCRGSGQA